MSNLVTPMLTSVENSPTVDFYPTSLCFSTSPCAIINNGNDQLCINESTELNDLEHLVGRSSLFKTSTPNKSKIQYNSRLFNKSYSVYHENYILENSKQMIKDDSRGGENSLSSNLYAVHSRVINNVWNASETENNSSKACNNINMGYNEGSSLESMVSHSNSKLKSEILVENNESDKVIIDVVEDSSNQVSDTASNQSRFTQARATTSDSSDNKTFKNGTKAGHSRQWGSCGSARTLHLHVDDSNTTKTKLLLELKPLHVMNVIKSPTIAVTPSPTTASNTTTATTLPEIRNTHSDKSHSHQNRNSQLSFEAEFDSDGKIHEQITVEFTQFDPYIMAAQITYIELTYFRAIKSEEFLSFKWTGLSKHTHAPGIVSSTRWFNQLNFWAQRVILECTELNRRSEMLTYLIRIIKKLVDTFNNLSSGMALMSALEVECIHRLKQTWNCLQNKDRATFRRMEELFSSGNNYEKLREHINSLKLPCIPYLGLYLTDLTYINVAHSKLSEFESQTKTDQINNILRTVSEFQQSEYDIVQFPMLYRYLDSQRYIEELQKIIEENNYRSSLALEPNMSDLSSMQDSSLSPPMSPPSYSCKHLPPVIPLQLPISPKPLSLRSNEEMSEGSGDHLMLAASDDPMSGDSSIDDDCGAGKVESLAFTDVVTVTGHFERLKAPGFEEESLMTSSGYSMLFDNFGDRISVSQCDSYDNDFWFDDEESVSVSLLCGTGRKSQFQKRSTSTSIRFKRDSSSSSRQQVSSKTATLSSTSQSVLSDKDLLGQHSKSLLDDSYLESTLADPTSSGLLSSEGQGLGLDDVLVVSNMPRSMDNVVCTPPICRCIIMKDEVQLIPKSRTDRRTEYINLFNIARAADLAARYSGKGTSSQTNAGDTGSVELMTTDESPDDRDVMKPICQGVLSRKACLKNAKKPRFSVWARHWAVLMMSKNNAYFVFFENSHFRALERKDFKSKSCHVQDLKKVLVSRVRPSLNLNISEQKVQIANDNSSDGDRSHRGNLKKFFLVDKEYGTVYKFRDPNSRSRLAPIIARDRRLLAGASNTVSDHRGNEPSILVRSPSLTITTTTVANEMPSLYTWYRLLKRAIRTVNNPRTDNKDLIVLTDS